MNLLNFDLRSNVHWNFIKFELQGFDLFAHFLNCLSCGLIFQMLVLLSNHEIDFLRFTIVFLPANVNVVFAVGSKRNPARAFTLNSYNTLVSLGRVECDLVLIYPWDSVAYINGHSYAGRRYSQALWIFSRQDHLQGVGALRKTQKSSG